MYFYVIFNARIVTKCLHLLERHKPTFQSGFTVVAHARLSPLQQALFWLVVFTEKMLENAQENPRFHTGLKGLPLFQLALFSLDF